MRGGGGLEALWIPFPKLPGVLAEGWGEGELHSLALLSFGRTLGRELAARYGQLSPRCGSGMAGGQGGGTEERGSFGAVANTKCYFLFVILGHESSRGWPRAFRALR